MAHLNAFARKVKHLAPLRAQVSREADFHQQHTGSTDWTSLTHRCCTSIINLKSINVKNQGPRSTGQLEAPGFKEVRKYLRNNQQREALGGFIKAGWTSGELGEFARQNFLAPGKTHPTAASYQYAMEKGADHLFAQETLASLRTPGFTMPPFNRPRPPKQFAWDDPDNPDHTPELKADIEEIARLWRNREAAWLAQPWPVEDRAIPRWFWKRLYKLRIRYHSLQDTLHVQGLSGYREPYTEDTKEDTK